MRWFWIDRFVEFESGHRAVAIKNITLAEEAIDEYIPAFPVMPSSLIIEGLAQTGGLLVGEHRGFRERVVLAKVANATFHQPAQPGDTLTYTAMIETIKADGAICRGLVHNSGELQAEVELMFAHLDERFGTEMFTPLDFLRLLRLLRLFDVGRTADGQPLQIPAHMLEAEQADLT